MNISLSPEATAQSLLPHLHSATEELHFACPHCDQHLCCGPEGAGTNIGCPSCQRDLDVPEPAAPTWPERVTTIPSYLLEPLPRPVTEAIRAFKVLGVIGLVGGMILGGIILATRDTDGSLVSTAVLLMIQGGLSLFTAGGIRQRASWARPLGYVLAVLFIPGALTIALALATLANLSRPEFKTWLAKAVPTA